MILKNARIQGTLCDITIKQGIITSLAPTTQAGMDLQGATVIPGLIDVHIHGCGGYDVMTGQLEAMSVFLAQHGTTAFLPTTVTSPMADIHQALGASLRLPGAQALGFHVEGPYLSPNNAGVHDTALLLAPDPSHFATCTNIKKMTIAPELPGSLAFIRQGDYQISLGHTACDTATALAAFDAGATCVTHLFNAMPPLLHRQPGLIGAAVEAKAYAELICDGVHVHKGAVLAAYGMFGPHRLMLISDGLPFAGLPNGTYTFGGQQIILQDGVAKTKDGTLAGSAKTLWQCVCKAVSFGIPFDHAVAMATDTPARSLGLNKGRLAVGYDADLLVIEGERIVKTMIAGAFLQG